MIIGIMLAFARVASFLYVIPIFKGRTIPFMAKNAIALSVAIFIHDKIEWDVINTLPEFILMLLMQVMMGVTLGFVVNMIFSIPQMAGALLDTDMGFSSSSMMDPSGGQRISLMANFYNVLFMLVFIMLGGIENIIVGITLSFHFTEAILFTANEHFLDTLMLVFNYMMISAIQIALPISATMFIINFMMLILGKVAPQLNIMLNMFPIKIAVGFMFIYFSVTITGEFFADIVENLNEHYLDVLESMYTK